MKFFIAPLTVFALFVSAPAEAAPCNVGSKTSTLLDQILDKDTMAEIKSDNVVKKEAYANITEILKGDECASFLLNSSKRKELAAAIIQGKEASTGTKSASIIGKFLAAF